MTLRYFSFLAIMATGVLGMNQFHTIGHPDDLSKRVCNDIEDPVIAAQMMPCPTSKDNNPLEWPCVRFADLCNGLPNCPNGEDETHNMCLFHNLFAKQLNELRRHMYLKLGGPDAAKKHAEATNIWY